MDAGWVEWSRRLQAIAQNGLAFSKDPFDRERFEQVRGIADEILMHHTDLDWTLVRDLLHADSGYATPKIDVRGAVFRGDRVLLVRERSDGRWSLPGGWADVGDSPSEAVVREILEESGFQTKVRRLIALFDRGRHPHPPSVFAVYKVFFLCDLVGGTASGGLETSEAGFFGRDELPPLSISRVTDDEIARVFAHKLDPNLPAEFD
jgi:ADP-ribose pyrophosphatase YjhB (NUDIX family)